MTSGPSGRQGVAMRSSSTVVLLCVLPLIFIFPSEATAANQPGDKGFIFSVGYADARAEGDYETDAAFTFAFEYHKTRNASYRGTAGLVTIDSGRSSGPGGMTLPDADALFFLGNLVLTARFTLLHPFVTFGLGVYSVRLTENNNTSNSLEIGANWGAGLDIQLLRHFALRGEILLHYTTGDLTSPVETLTLGGRFTY
jgi:hypothetical protein